MHVNLINVEVIRQNVITPSRKSRKKKSPDRRELAMQICPTTLMRERETRLHISACKFSMSFRRRESRTSYSSRLPRHFIELTSRDFSALRTLNLDKFSLVIEEKKQEIQ